MMIDTIIIEKNASSKMVNKTLTDYVRQSVWCLQTTNMN